jgi:predicted Fe-Mo cluster-binding NifX family protein
MTVIALPVYRRRIAPAFDFSRKVLIVNLNAGNDRTGSELDLQGLSNVERMEALSEAGVTTLICGGITDGLHHMLVNRGIQVIWGIAGSVEEVLDAYQANRLGDETFLMPGSKSC